MITIALVFAGVVSTFAVMKYMISKNEEAGKKRDEKQDIFEKFMNEKAPLLDHLSKTEDEMRKQISKQSENITSLKEKISQAPSMKEVRDEFVSKEMFKQMEKHMDGKFDMLQEGQNKILQELRNERR